jgi:hypothetical protein
METPRVRHVRLMVGEERHGELLHGHGSSPLGFIKGGDASAWGVFEITAFLLQTFPLSLPPFFTADLLLIAAHHGREGHQNG